VSLASEKWAANSEISIENTYGIFAESFNAATTIVFELIGALIQSFDLGPASWQRFME
jgi:hypothetical protein